MNQSMDDKGYMDYEKTKLNNKTMNVYDDSAYNIEVNS